jgi:hypothetical protein
LKQHRDRLDGTGVVEQEGGVSCLRLLLCALALAACGSCGGWPVARPRSTARAAASVCCEETSEKV